MLANVNEKVIIVALDKTPQDELLDSSQRGIFFSVNKIEYLK